MKTSPLHWLKKTGYTRPNTCLWRLSSKKERLAVFSTLMAYIAEDLTMKMRIQWGKMGFSRCIPCIIRCATKTRALANITQTTTLSPSTSIHESIMCDFPLFPMSCLTNVYS